MRIGHKIALGFGLFTLVICVIGSFILSGNREIQAHFTVMKEDIVPGAMAMMDTQVLIQKMVMEAREYSRTGDPVHVEAVRMIADNARQSAIEHTEHELHIDQEEHLDELAMAEEEIRGLSS